MFYGKAPAPLETRAEQSQASRIPSASGKLTHQPKNSAGRGSVDSVVPKGNSAETEENRESQRNSLGFWGGKAPCGQGRGLGGGPVLPCLFSGYISAADEIAARSVGVFGPSHARDL